MALYGRHWLDLWAGTRMDEVKAAWTVSLAGCSVGQIKRAVEWLRENRPFPPTCPEFIAICKQFPDPEPAAAPALPRLRGPSQYLDNDVPYERKHDGKDWARRIRALVLARRKVPLISVEYAREVLLGLGEEFPDA